MVTVKGQSLKKQLQMARREVRILKAQLESAEDRDADGKELRLRGRDLKMAESYLCRLQGYAKQKS